MRDKLQAASSQHLDYLENDIEAFLHSRAIPLNDAVDTSQTELLDISGFGNECEGYCGV